MRLKSFDQLKKAKPFYVSDVIIYCVIAVFTGILFLSVFLTQDKSGAAGFYVYCNNVKAAEYFFSDGEFKISEGFGSNFSVTDKGIYFYPNAENLSDFNLIVIDVQNKTVSITEATCQGRECLSQKVTENGGFIYCAPHGLKISPAGYIDPTTG